MKYRIIFGIGLIALVYGLHRQQSVSGCAPAPPAGFGVTIQDEFALIVWDPNTKLEHFIRVANFQTEAPDIGFLVPTPSVPTLTEVDAAGISRLLNQQTQARVVTKTKIVTRYGLGPKPSWRGPSATPTGASRAVEVLGEYSVAGYEATVLRADDPAALRDWLDQHEYETSDPLQDWLQIYTDQQWIITAFKLSKNRQASSLTSKGVRMSFQSEQPFYPYREPASDGVKPKAGSRLLRVFLLADQRYEGRIGSEHPWNARTVWSGEIADYQLRQLARFAGADGTTLPIRLTEFEDRSFPRPGIDELYFHPAATQAKVERPTRTRIITREKYFPGWRGAIVAGVTATPLIVLVTAGFWVLRRHKAKSSGKKIPPGKGD